MSTARYKPLADEAIELPSLAGPTRASIEIHLGQQSPRRRHSEEFDSLKEDDDSEAEDIFELEPSVPDDSPEALVRRVRYSHIVPNHIYFLILCCVSDRTSYR
jgi:hypothetical protein